MNYDYKNANLYAAAFHAFRLNFPGALLTAALITFLAYLETVFDSAFNKYVAPVMLVTFFAYVIHDTIIFNREKGLNPLTLNKAKGQHPTGFFLRTAAFLLVLIAIVLLCAFIPFWAGYRGESAKGLGILKNRG